MPISETHFYINLQDFSNEVKDEYKIEVFFNNDLNLTKALDVFNKILQFRDIV